MALNGEVAWLCLLCCNTDSEYLRSASRRQVRLRPFSLFLGPGDQLDHITWPGVNITNLNTTITRYIHIKG